MYLVFDVGATTIKYATMTSEGDILEKGKVRTPVAEDEGVEDFVAAIGAIYDGCKDSLPTSTVSSEDADAPDIKGIAMGLPGQVDVKRGIVYNGGGIRYLHEVHLQELVEARCDHVPVSLENDGKCAALAEVWLGNAMDVKDACVLVFGTGIGGALIKNRKVIHGKHLLSGEVSYIFEDMTREEADNLPEGDNLMERLPSLEMVEAYPYTWATKRATISVCHWVAKKKGLTDEEVTGELLYKWVDEGDKEVADMLEDTYFSIAKMCLNLYVIFDPEIILIGGGISVEPRFLEGISRYVTKLKKLSNVYSSIRLDNCKFFNDSNLLGALYNFKQKYNLETR
ncbi:MAG: ROK family protein [Lachnospiraceae bacterium]|nr:ROK family protein [Lachnospiraceae bacterium]